MLRMGIDLALAVPRWVRFRRQLFSQQSERSSEDSGWTSDEGVMEQSVALNGLGMTMVG